MVRTKDCKVQFSLTNVIQVRNGKFTNKANRNSHVQRSQRPALVWRPNTSVVTSVGNACSLSGREGNQAFGIHRADPVG